MATRKKPTRLQELQYHLSQMVLAKRAELKDIFFNWSDAKLLDELAAVRTRIQEDTAHLEVLELVQEYRSMASAFNSTACPGVSESKQPTALHASPPGRGD